MLTLRHPTAENLRQFLLHQAVHLFSYPFVGATRGTPPAGYDVDHNRIQLGTGRDTFEHAKAALRRWEMFNLGWVRVQWPETPITEHSTVAVIAHVWGLWVTNACRIVYVQEETGPVDTYGFAYGTLPAHVERGEERFLVQWDHRDDSVWYDLLAISQPRHLLARVGYPYMRHLQRCFARDSLRAMRRAVSQAL
ncbi:MAG: DUF1990 domain-containing protein [Deltaproteobacteria bacterium]|nr:DUF1990 domain-containing protein [Deltaproteobacteria bacterium]